MTLSPEQLIELNALAIDAATKAAQTIFAYADKKVNVELKPGVESLASQVVTEVDRLSQDTIIKALEPSIKKYGLGLLSEESEDNESRFVKDYFWCIDPLDGTLPFSEGKPGYSVAISLISKDGIPQIGVIADPANGSIYHAIKGQRAFKDGNKLQLNDFTRSKDEFTLIVDRSFFNHEFYEASVQSFDKYILSSGYSKLTLLNLGGAVVNALSVLEKSPACYFKFPKKAKGGGAFWDYAPTTCIFNELNAFACDIQGNPLLFDRKSTYMNESGIIYCTDKNILRFVVSLYKENL